MRSRIRKRVFAGVHDLALLFDELDEEDYEQVMSDIGVSEPTDMWDSDMSITPSDPLLRALGFFFKICQTEDNFRILTKNSIQEVLDQRGRRYDLNTSIEIEYVKKRDSDKLRSQFEQGNITFREIGEYFREGALTIDEFIQLSHELQSDDEN